MSTSGVWTVYIVRCADDTLYTGISSQLHKRIETHNRGRGAKYTAARRPVKLVWFEDAQTRSAASKREYAIKKLSRAQKLALISQLPKPLD